MALTNGMANKHHDDVPSLYNPGSLQSPHHDTYGTSPYLRPDSVEDRSRRLMQFSSESDGFMDRVRKEKEARRRAEVEEKKYDLQQLMDYNPWGKPGGGAPRQDDYRKQKFTEMDLKLDIKHHGNLAGLKFYRPGAGAPMVTEAGDLKTQIPGDPTIRYKDDRKPHTHRYCKPREEAQELLDELRRAELEKAHREENERLWNLKKDQVLMDYDPYGKPGAGAPNHPTNFRTPRIAKVESSPPWRRGADYRGHDYSTLNFHRQTGHVVKEGFMVHPNDQIDSRWDKFEGAPTTLPLGITRGHGAPRISESGNAITKMKNSLDMKHGRSNVEDFVEKEAHWGRTNPGFLGFGSPGGGAPIATPNGHIKTGFRDEIYKPEDLERKHDAKDVVAKETQHDLLVRELRKKKEEQEYQRGPNQSMAAQMMNSHMGKPRRDPENHTLLHHHRVRTDLYDTIRKSPRRTKEAPEYHNELLSQMQEREERNKMIKKLDIEHSNYHFEESPRFYGRPGCGAPLHEKDHRRPNLMRLLMNIDPSPTKFSDDANVRIPISDGYSTGRNCYEYPDRMQNKMSFNLDPPFATAIER